MQLLMAEEEEARREEEGGRERRRSTLLHPSSSPTKFDYSTYHDSNNTFSFPDFQEREVCLCLLFVRVYMYIVYTLLC